MYKVLIADDEKLIRITLKNMIDWKALDCDIVALAKDGKEAYEIYKEVHPEIVITDLKMPEMDGITLISKIHEDNKNTQVIALSNYSDFELVRDAMKAGAFDYLLKVTLEEKELENIIRQVKESCEASAISTNEDGEKAMKALQHQMVLSKNEHHTMDQEEFLKLLNNPLFDDYKEHYQMAYFRVDNIYGLYENKIKDHIQLKTNLADLIKESIPMHMKHMDIFISNHSGVIIFQSSEKIRVMNVCNSILRDIVQYMDIHVSIILSDKAYGFNEFFSIYQTLLAAQEKRFYIGEGTLIQLENIQAFQELNMNQITYHIDIIEAVKAKGFAQVSQLIEDALLYMKQHMIKPIQVLEYFVFIFNNIEGNEIAKGCKQAFHFDKVNKRIHTCETLDKLATVLEESFQLVEDWVKDTNTNKYRKEIMDIIQYIDENYTRKISLTMIAEHFEMTESYLSRMFKSETGKNLIYCINEKKMKKALELLIESDVKIKDISTSLGMEDQLYFNKVFKKFYNISPSEYRKKASGDN